MELKKLGEDEFLRHALKGIEPAVRFVKQLVFITNVWAEIDSGKVSKDSTSKMMWNALVEMQANPFYAKFRGHLDPVLQSTIMRYETGDTMRSAVADMIVYCAGLVSDVDWVAKVGPEIRKRYAKG